MNTFRFDFFFTAMSLTAHEFGSKTCPYATFATFVEFLGGKSLQPLGDDIALGTRDGQVYPESGG